jgi:hypothetical protein
MKGPRRALKVFMTKTANRSSLSLESMSVQMDCHHLRWCVHGYLPTALFRIASDQLFDCVAENITVP